MNVAPSQGFPLPTRSEGGERSGARKDGRAEQEAAAWSGLRYPGSTAGPGEKRREAVKGRKAAKRSDVYPLRRILFTTLKRARPEASSIKNSARRATDSPPECGREQTIARRANPKGWGGKRALWGAA